MLKRLKILLKFHSLFFIGFLLASSLLFADSKSPSPSKNAVLEQFFAQTQSLQADFQQSISELYGKTLESSSGKIIMQRPHQFVLNYEKPERQQYVSDGKTLWMFDEELEQVSIKSFDEGLANSPALFISSNQQLDQSYHISDAHDPQRPELKIVKLVPKGDDNLFSSVYLAFKDGLLIELLMQDNFEQVTKLEFSEIKINAQLPEDTFRFKIPDDVDVIGTMQ